MPPPGFPGFAPRLEESRPYGFTTPPPAVDVSSLAAALAQFTQAGVVGWLVPSALHTVLAVTVCAVGTGGLAAVFEPVTACAAMCGVRSRAIPPAIGALHATRPVLVPRLSVCPAGVGGFLVRDLAGQYRPAEADEVLLAAQRLLASQVRGSDVMSSPAVVKELLAHAAGATAARGVRGGASGLPEGHRLRRDVSGHCEPNGGLPQEVVRDAMARNSSALLLVHNHPSGTPEPSRADEALDEDAQSGDGTGGRQGSRTPDRHGALNSVHGRARPRACGPASLPGCSRLREANLKHLPTLKWQFRHDLMFSP